jgi:hypothetical protein
MIHSHNPKKYSKNISKIIRYYSSADSPIYLTYRPTITTSKHIYLKNSKSILTLHSQTNHRTLYTHFTISNNKLSYPHKCLSNLITEPNTSISRIIHNTSFALNSKPKIQPIHFKSHVKHFKN